MLFDISHLLVPQLLLRGHLARRSAWKRLRTIEVPWPHLSPAPVAHPEPVMAAGLSAEDINPYLASLEQAF